MDAPVLKTSRLVVRPMAAEDAGPVFLYRSDPEVGKHQLWHPRDEKEVADFISSLGSLKFNTPDTWFQLAICLRTTGELIGDLGLHFIGPENHDTEIGVTVSPSHQRHGFASEALRAVLDHLLGKMRKRRVFASVEPSNKASIALMRNLGLKKEPAQGHTDVVIYATARGQ
jgi:RimJ/RimL family protein N-acetyltransferase